MRRLLAVAALVALAGCASFLPAYDTALQARLASASGGIEEQLVKQAGYGAGDFGDEDVAAYRKIMLDLRVARARTEAMSVERPAAERYRDRIVSQVDNLIAQVKPQQDDVAALVACRKTAQTAAAAATCPLGRVVFGASAIETYKAFRPGFDATIRNVENTR